MLFSALNQNESVIGENYGCGVWSADISGCDRRHRNMQALYTSNLVSLTEYQK